MNVQATEADYLESIRFDERNRPLLKQTTLLLLIITLILLGLKTGQFIAEEGSLAGVIVFAFMTLYLLGLIALRYWLLVPRRVRRIYHQQKSLHEPFEFEVVDSGLKFDSALGSGVLPWDHVDRWRESKNLILIDHSEGLCNILPKRAFESPGTVEKFKATLMDKVGPANQPRPISM